MHEKERIELSLEDEAVRLSELTGTSINVANMFVLAEDEYLDMVGVNVYEGEENINSEEVVVNVQEMINYIVSVAGIDEELCYRLEDAERKYFCEIGIMDGKDYEGEFM